MSQQVEAKRDDEARDSWSGIRVISSDVGLAFHDM